MPVASELARAGLRSRPKACHRGLPEGPQPSCWGRFTPQREQAPSPRRPRSGKERGVVHMPRGLLALGCAAGPRPVTGVYLKDRNRLVGAASRPSGSKLPRHNDSGQSRRVASYTCPWRASLLALGCAAGPRPVTGVYLKDRNRLVGGVSHPSGSKLPRHGDRAQARTEAAYTCPVAAM